MELRSLIRNVPDFPIEGIQFKDITTLLKDAAGLKASVDQLCKPYLREKIDYVVGIESRGFIFGSAMALKLNAGFIVIRKPGKLPAETISEEYELEYGTDTIEIHKDAIEPGKRILLVDDLLATGGTASAAIRLLNKMDARITAAVFLIELSFLNGREKLGNTPVHSLIQYQGE